MVMSGFYQFTPPSPQPIIPTFCDLQPVTQTYLPNTYYISPIPNQVNVPVESFINHLPPSNISVVLPAPTVQTTVPIYYQTGSPVLLPTPIPRRHNTSHIRRFQKQSSSSSSCNLTGLVQRSNPQRLSFHSKPPSRARLSPQAGKFLSHTVKIPATVSTPLTASSSLKLSSSESGSVSRESTLFVQSTGSTSVASSQHKNCSSKHKNCSTQHKNSSAQHKNLSAQHKNSSAQHKNLVDYQLLQAQKHIQAQQVYNNLQHINQLQRDFIQKFAFNNSASYHLDLSENFDREAEVADDSSSQSATLDSIPSYPFSLEKENVYQLYPNTSAELNTSGSFIDHGLILATINDFYPTERDLCSSPSSNFSQHSSFSVKTDTSLEVSSKKNSSNRPDFEQVWQDCSERSVSPVCETPVQESHTVGRLTSCSSLSLSNSEDTMSDSSQRGTKRVSKASLVTTPEKKRHCSHEEEASEVPSSSCSSKSSCTSQNVEDTYPLVSDTMWRYFLENTQPDYIYLKKMKLRDAIYSVLKGVFPYCGLYIVGSSMNGFGSKTSDMDMCLMLSYAEIDQKHEAPELLRVIFKALKKCTFLVQVRLIYAKVPILKFVDKISNIECDLNINNAVGIRNTHLLNIYSKIDRRVSPLVLWVKHWANYHNINDASQSTISSYSLVLMVLHYLQVSTQPFVIPSLQKQFPAKFNRDTDIRLLTLKDSIPSFESPNKQSLGELFVGFLAYYSTEFKFDSDGISVRLGVRVSKNTLISQDRRNPVSQWKYLSIEDIK